MKYSCLLASFLVILFLFDEFNPDSPNMKLSINNSDDFTFISHRGAAGLAPENTLSSIDSAIFYKAPYIEIDVQRTKDNALILMHDRSLNRTTNGKGKIVKKNWAEIKDLDAGSHFSDDFAGERVPTLSQALERIKKSNTTLVIEVKKPGIYPGIGAEIIDVIKQTQTMEQAIIISFDIDFILKLRALDSSVKLGCLYVFPPRSSAKELSKVSHISVNWRSNMFCKHRVKKIQNKGIKVWAWTVNSVKKIKKLRKTGFDGVTTDYPDLFE